MICVECGQPVNDLHHQFRGSGILLTRCEYCNCVADKYVEHEGVIIFLDLILHKPQVAMQACVCVRARARARVRVCYAGVRVYVCHVRHVQICIFACLHVCVTCVTCREICMHGMQGYMHTNVQAYRHLLFNRMAYCEHGLRFRDIQLAFFVIITEAYSKTQSQPHAKKGFESFALCGLMFDACSLYARMVIRKDSAHRVTCARTMYADSL